MRRHTDVKSLCGVQLGTTCHCSALKIRAAIRNAVSDSPLYVFRKIVSHLGPRKLGIVTRRALFECRGPKALFSTVSSGACRQPNVLGQCHASFARFCVERRVMRDVFSVNSNRPNKASFTARDVGNAFAIDGSSSATDVPFAPSA
ncbi:protein of unknown function [Candidatus Methylomirabilis oxygeniifera]|uniref:Uncharacterized protein n=1 Tax=Methylomirabilis oxygeniifera TaxID=671143 RepID=D5MLN9_METO1|nr:protein of unknown function [Candidatus Methylomirabilis oxyfera]